MMITKATVVGGLVTAQAEGTAIITATTADGRKTDTVTVTVTAATVAVESVSINKTTLSLVEGEKSTTLVATVTPQNATYKTVSWSSSDITKATVVGGLVTAQAEGTAIITATTADGGKTDTVTVTVTAATVAVESVSINKRTLSLVEGEKSTTLVTTVTPQNAEDKTVIWSSSDITKATVVGGLVTAQAEGDGYYNRNYCRRRKNGYCNCDGNSYYLLLLRAVSINKATLSLVEGEKSTTLVTTVTPHKCGRTKQ